MPTPESVDTSDFKTLNQLFLEAIEKRPKSDAFLYKAQGRYHPCSSQDALKKTAAFASALLGGGIRAGDRVAILAENRLEWALTDYAVMGLGAMVVPIYPTLLDPDVEFILRDSEAKAIVASTEIQLAKVLNIKHRLPELALVVMMDPVPASAVQVESWHKLVESELAGGTDLIAPFRKSSLTARPEDTATILYTSGTTGRAKGVVLTHNNISSNIRATLMVLTLSDRDTAISFLPLSHIFERMLDYSYFWRGVSIAYAESLEALPKNLLEVRPTVVAVVPRVLEKILDKVKEKVRRAPSVRRRLFHWAVNVGKDCFRLRQAGRVPRLGMRVKRAVADALVFKKIRAGTGGRLGTIISGAAPLSRDVAEFFHSIGLPVYEGYGLTETSPVIAVNYPGAFRLGTVGRLIPGIEVRLGEEFTGVEGGVSAEILVRGPNVTPGYYHLDAANREAFLDGWFRTGDLGELDADGFLRITGRKKNLLKTSGGKFIAPEKLENLFQGHPYVAQIIVLGEARHFVSALIVPNLERLENYARDRGIAFHDHESLVANPEIHKFIQGQVDEATRELPRYERIHQVALLPREFTIASGELSPSLKIKRMVVEERYRDLIEEIYQSRVEEQASEVRR